MNSITQLHGITPEKLTETILEGVKIQIENLKNDVHLKVQDEYLTRKETAQLLKISLVCLHDWCNKGIIKPYKLGNRTYFSRRELVECLLNSNR